MTDLDKVTLPSGSTYNLKDTQARQDIETLKATAVGAVHYIGVTTAQMDAINSGITAAILADILSRLTVLEGGS